jgi:type IV pilus assembly protein PilZ
MERRAEQRRSQRLAIEMPVEVTSRDSWERFPGLAKDISLGGMFIETAFPAAFGVAVFVSFTLPGHRTPMLVSGIVRWTSPSGMGIQFGSLGASETHAITEIERERSSSPPVHGEGLDRASWLDEPEPPTAPRAHLCTADAPATAPRSSPSAPPPSSP